MSKVEDDGVIYDHKHSSLLFNCLRCFTCTRMTNTRIEKQRLIQETTKCHWCCPKTQVTQIDQDQIDDIQLRRHMILWCCCGKCKFFSCLFRRTFFFLSNSPRTHQTIQVSIPVSSECGVKMKMKVRQKEKMENQK